MKGRIGKIVLTMAWVGISAGGVFAKPISDEVRELRAEVKTLKLARDLDLSSQQIRSIRDLALQAVELRQGFQEDLQGMEARTIAHLQAQKEALLAGRELGEATEKGKALKSEARERRQAMKEQMKPIVEEAMAVFTPEQKEQLATLLRKKHRRGPAGKVVRALQKAREVSDEEYPELKAEVLNRHGEAMAKHGATGAEISESAAKLSNALDDVRAMDERTFKESQDEIVGELLPKKRGARRGARSGSTDRRGRGTGLSPRRGSRHGYGFGPSGGRGGRQGRGMGDRARKGGKRRIMKEFGRWLSKDSTVKALEELLATH